MKEIPSKSKMYTLVASFSSFCFLWRHRRHPFYCILLRSEIPSGICAKLRTVAASNNRVHMITLLLLVRATYLYGVILHAHPVRGESRNQGNTTGEVATIPVGRVRHTMSSSGTTSQSVQLQVWALDFAQMKPEINKLKPIRAFYQTVIYSVTNFYNSRA